MTIREALEKHNQFHALEVWDNELNHGTPDEIKFQERVKFYFKCERGLHKSNPYDLSHIFSDVPLNFKCRGCNSFGQKVIDKFGQEFLDKIWSEKNKVSAFEVSYHSKTKLWLNCENGIHEPYQRNADSSFSRNCRCPECSNLIHPNQKKNLVGQKFGRLTVMTRLPFNKKQGGTYYLCNCDCGIKNIRVQTSILTLGKQVSCGCWRREQFTGSNNCNWKGGVLSPEQKDRNSQAYDLWRRAVYKRDDYTCQCCGKRGGRLNAHHIKSFSKYPELRFDVSNGITLCDNCHAFDTPGSLHNVYGVRDVTPEQLYEYINQRKENTA
jgi:5-methylcytosine-specific restriction endonuclease McrA